MRQFKFTLPKAAVKKENQLVGGKYPFVKGEMVVGESDARLMKKVLTKFYGCKVEVVPGTEPDETEASEDDESLATASTKGKK